MTTPHHHEQDDVTVREIPKLRYGAIGWVVLALFLAAMAAWELRMRSLGLAAGDLDDGPSNWAVERKRLETGASVLSDSARATQQKEVDRLQTELQRASQDAQKAVEDLQNELQVEFQRKLLPVLNEVSAAKGLHMVFSSVDSGVVWADPGLDITTDIVRKLDAAAGTAPAK